MNEGWVKLHRKIVDNYLWFSEKFTRGQAWVDLILLANHKENTIRIRGVKVDIKRGQCGWSEQSLADRWQWSRGKVRRFLNELETEQQIVQQKNNVITLITITNYNDYQSNGTADSTANDTASSTTNGQQTVQQTDTNKNDNNQQERKERKEILKKLRQNSPYFDSDEIFEMFCDWVEVYEMKHGKLHEIAIKQHIKDVNTIASIPHIKQALADAIKGQYKNIRYYKPDKPKSDKKMVFYKGEWKDFEQLPFEKWIRILPERIRIEEEEADKLEYSHA